ncbi:unnamed protein product, partial [marine sediment metagenome]
MLSEYVEKVLKIREECPRQSMAVREYALVYMVAETVKPRRILEAGTGYGFSTHVLHKACPTAEIDSIDNLSDRLGEEWGKYVRGVRNVHLICGDSKDIIPRLVQERDYGLALLDDGHSEEIVFKNVVDCT